MSAESERAIRGNVARVTGARIAVIGIGAIGGSVSADLADLGCHELLLCSRTPFDRLQVRHPGGSSTLEMAPRLRPEDVASERVDWVLLATKAHQSAQARPWLDALCGDGTRLAVLQNGVDHVERIGPMLAAHVELLPVVVKLPAEKTAPGRVEPSRDGWLIVPEGVAGRAFAVLFAGARTQVWATEEFLSQGLVEALVERREGRHMEWGARNALVGRLGRRSLGGRTRVAESLPVVDFVASLFSQQLAGSSPSRALPWRMSIARAQLPTWIGIGQATRRAALANPLCNAQAPSDARRSPRALSRCAQTRGDPPIEAMYEAKRGAGVPLTA